MKDNYTDICHEDANPNPEFLIKSIAEQGYSLESALADLMDNSVSAEADRIEILINTEKEPFNLFLTDNGNGMDEKELSLNLKFPSNSPETKRPGHDLGRFGLGLKTASFSQTRRFTVISRKKGTEIFAGRTWDVEYLRLTGSWRIIVNTEKEISDYIEEYNQLSENHLNKSVDFFPNVVVVWQGLYKFEDYLDQENRIAALQKEITEITSEHLSVVFHRFMERESSPLSIRVNNALLKSFNPFPVEIPDFRAIDYKTKSFQEEIIKLEGFVLPSRSLDESKDGISPWVTSEKSLMDMEGIYIYRADRLIRFGGWHGIIKKMPRLQLARLRVEIGNGADHLIHLNVAKSQIVIPHDLKQAFLRYVIELRKEAEKEFFNRVNPVFPGSKKEVQETLFRKRATAKGGILELNHNYLLIKELKSSLTKKQEILLAMLIRMINTTVNKIKQVHNDQDVPVIAEENQLSASEIADCIGDLLSKGVSGKQIKDGILPHLGFTYESFPPEIKKMLSHE